MVLIEVPKKFLFWTVVCGVCATPSFLFAVDALGYDEPPDFAAMILGVVVFILAYTLATSDSSSVGRLRLITSMCSSATLAPMAVHSSGLSAT